MSMPSKQAIASASTPAAGQFVADASGTALAIGGVNGYLKVRLNIPVGAIATLTGGGEVAGSEIFKITLDSNGVPAAGQTTWTSDQFSSPVNPGFNIEVHNGNDRTVGTIQAAVITGPGPVDLTTLIGTNNGVSYPGAILSNPGANQTISTGNLTITNNLTVGGTATVNNLDSRIFVDGTHYALTAAGIQQAINDAVSVGSREVHLPAGSINISTTLTITHGGLRLVGCGAGVTDAGSTPATALIYTGSAGSDLLQITGQVSSRLDKVILENLILDGNATARYTLRTEKIDVPTFRDMRIRGGATANWYNVDSTGIKLYNFGCTAISGYGIVLDWGSTAFGWYGGQFDMLQANSHPFFVIQGTGNTFTISNVEFNAGGSSTFNGFASLQAFDTNSSFTSAPTGGAGAPKCIIFENCQFNYGSGASAAASQGSDILVSGTATNPITEVIFEGCYFSGNSIGAISVKTDQANNIKIINGRSEGHTTATLTNTVNSSNVALLFVQSTDSARTSGAGSIMDITPSSGGIMQSAQGFAAPAFVSTSSNVASAGQVRLASADAVKFRNNANSGDLAIAKDTNDQLTWPNRIKVDTVRITGATFGTAVNELGIGTTNGFGNGASGTAVTTTAKGTGSGPTTAQTVVKYLNINIGGTDFWIPLMQ